MDNILGHTNDLKLYAACGNIRYKYTNDGEYVEETFFDNKGEVTKHYNLKL
jgi:hypothetical protein